MAPLQRNAKNSSRILRIDEDGVVGVKIACLYQETTRTTYLLTSWVKETFQMNLGGDSTLHHWASTTFPGAPLQEEYFMQACFGFQRLGFTS
jgi:hypothetical protein